MRRRVQPGQKICFIGRKEGLTPTRLYGGLPELKRFRARAMSELSSQLPDLPSRRFLVHLVRHGSTAIDR